MANYSRLGEFLPIATLAAGFKGPVIFADESQEIQWFSEKGGERTTEHVEHARDETGQHLYDGTHDDGSQKPKMSRITD
jgi:hypothetical protein